VSTSAAPASIVEIVDLMINNLEKRLDEQDMAIELTPAAKALLAQVGDLFLKDVE